MGHSLLNPEFLMLFSSNAFIAFIRKLKPREGKWMSLISSVGEQQITVRSLTQALHISSFYSAPSSATLTGLSWSRLSSSLPWVGAAALTCYQCFSFDLQFILHPATRIIFLKHSNAHIVPLHKSFSGLEQSFSNINMQINQLGIWFKMQNLTQ